MKLRNAAILGSASLTAALVISPEAFAASPAGSGNPADSYRGFTIENLTSVDMTPKGRDDGKGLVFDDKTPIKSRDARGAKVVEREGLDNWAHVMFALGSGGTAQGIQVTLRSQGPHGEPQASCQPDNGTKVWCDVSGTTVRVLDPGTRPFTIQNLTGDDMTLGDVEEGKGIVLPSSSTIRPGASMSAAVSEKQGVDNWTSATFTFPGKTGGKDRKLKITLRAQGPHKDPQVACKVTSGNPQTRCDPEGTTMKVIHEKPEDVNVTDSATQNRLIGALCQEGLNASCDYKATKTGDGPAVEVPVSDEKKNCGTDPVTDSVDWNHTARYNQSGSVPFDDGKGNLTYLGNKVKAAVGGVWQTGYEFKGKNTRDIPPGSTGKLVAELPMKQVTGDYTLKVGDSTYRIKNATADFPNPAGQVKVTTSTSPDPTCGPFRQSIAKKDGDTVAFTFDPADTKGTTLVDVHWVVKGGSEKQQDFRMNRQPNGSWTITKQLSGPDFEYWFTYGDEKLVKDTDRFDGSGKPLSGASE
ncbi:hypothetical protein ACIRS1_27550 [Kitasatospora sp. NPDC101176]|uniref:hypothetical protein n=1 Tax=Kitasatospora sp. NPDC101176 TaxID=3364099 RepID=UPI00380C9BFA